MALLSAARCSGCVPVRPIYGAGPGAIQRILRAPKSGLTARGSPPEWRGPGGWVARLLEGAPKMIRVTVWGENVHEQKNETVKKVYPEGMHACIA